VDADRGGALILAAGFSRRFGADKRWHPLADGTPMLIRTLSRYAAVFEQLAVVLRPEDEVLAQEVRTIYPAARVVLAPEAHLGMGHSLAAGVRAIEREWQYACIGLADMPYVTAATLTRLLAVYRSGDPDRIVQPVLGDRPGHPVIFGAQFFAEIESVTGDEGARSVLQKHPDALERVPVDDAGVVTDLDQPGSE
jgi:molybdenum cofactor cytidylyltransferase